MADSGFEFLAERQGETDEEQRMREALSRKADEFMSTLDAAVRLRTAQDPTKRMRNMARSSLQDACFRSMEAFAMSRK